MRKKTCHLPQLTGCYMARLIVCHFLSVPCIFAVEAVSNVRFTFKSEYREEDIEYSIRKILPEDAVSTLVSRARIGWTVDYLS